MGRQDRGRGNRDSEPLKGSGLRPTAMAYSHFETLLHNTTNVTFTCPLWSRNDPGWPLPRIMTGVNTEQGAWDMINRWELENSERSGDIIKSRTMGSQWSRCGSENGRDKSVGRSGCTFTTETSIPGTTDANGCISVHAPIDQGQNVCVCVRTCMSTFVFDPPVSQFHLCSGHAFWTYCKLKNQCNRVDPIDSIFRDFRAANPPNAQQRSG